MQEGFEEEKVKASLLKYTAQQIKFDLLKHHPKVLEHFVSTQNDREYHFWERRPYASVMYNRKVVEQKLDYMHNNPLTGKWKLVDRPEDYYFSSASFYMLNRSEFNFITHYKDHI